MLTQKNTQRLKDALTYANQRHIQHTSIFNSCYNLSQDLPPAMSLLSFPAHQSPRGQVGLSWGALEQRCLSRWKQCSLRRPLSDKRVPLPLLLYHNTAVEWLQSPNGCRYLLLVWIFYKSPWQKKKKKMREKQRGGSECMYGFNVGTPLMVEVHLIW